MKSINKCSRYAPFVLRIGVGLIFLIHGYQKMFIQGFDGVAGFFGGIGIPLALFFAYVVTILELAGGLMLILGLLTRWISGLLAINMVIAFLVVHVQNGFYVSGGGYEFVLVLFVASVSLLLSGAGVLSLDRKYCEKPKIEN